MSDVSNKLLQSSHKGVHEQFDMLAAAMQIQSLLQSDIFYAEVEGKPEKYVNKWIRESAARRMRDMGYSPGFTQKRLLLYIFQLYERFYEQYVTLLPFKHGTPTSEVQYSILLLAAPYLDNEFSTTGLADICGFLKQDVGQVAAKLTK